MSDDHDGLADDPRPGQQQGIEKTAREAGNSDFQGVLPAQEASSQSVQTSTVDPGLSHVEYYEAYGGELPHPRTLEAYPEEVQKLILDAYAEKVKCEFSDRSKRADKLADAEIASRKRSQILSFLVDMTFIVASFIVLALTGNPFSLLGLAIPGGALCGNVYIAIKSNRDKDKQDESSSEPKQLG